MTPGSLLLGAALALLSSVACAARAPRLWLGTALAGAGAGLVAAAWVLLSGTAWEARVPLVLGGQAVHLRLDGLSAHFLALASVVGGAGAAYARGYWTDRAHPASAARGRACWSAALLCIGLVLSSANGLHFLVAWELFVLAAFALITLDARGAEVRSAGWLYLAVSHAGTLALFAFFALLAVRTGSWDLGPMRERAELAPLYWLALFGFGVKSGLFPLHVWLPSAHANAPSHVSALLSGVAIKMGIYGLMRFSGWLPTPAAAGWVVAGLGASSAVLGVAFALAQHDLKRLLAYHSVENIGIILIGLGFALVAASRGDAAWGGVALAGSLLHVWNHGLFKALLFLDAGAVAQATGTREMSRLGGLWRAMPWTTASFAIGAAAICGLPPLNGFVSELLIYLGLLDALGPQDAPALAAAAAIVALSVTGALALACFAKVCGIVFLGSSRLERAGPVRERGPWMLAPAFALAGLCVAIGLLPSAVWPALHAAGSAWRGTWTALQAPEALAALDRFHGALLVLCAAAAVALRRRTRRRGPARGLTWDCGFAAPAARMQYSAGSFAALLTDWFGWILLPHRRDVRPQEPFAREASFESHTGETVLERVVAPAGRQVLRLSRAAQRLQHGRSQAYVLYLVLGLAVVAALALMGGTS